MKVLFCLSSGSHFTPPFTLAIYLCGGLQMNMVLPYLACQLLGGVLGAAMAKVSPGHLSDFPALSSAADLWPDPPPTGHDLQGELRQSPRRHLRRAAVQRRHGGNAVRRGCHDLPGHPGGPAGGRQRQDVDVLILYFLCYTIKLAF